MSGQYTEGRVADDGEKAGGMPPRRAFASTVESGKMRPPPVVRGSSDQRPVRMRSNPFTPPVSPVDDMALPADEVELDFELSYHDLLLFNWMHQLTSPVMQLLFMALPVLTFGREVSQGGLLAGLMPLLGLFLFLWALQLASVALLLVTRRNRTLLTRHFVRLGPDALRQRSRYVETTVYWPGVSRVVGRPGFVAVYQSQNGAQIVPNRAFGGRAQRDEFLRYAKERLAVAAAG
jgi:hypothetical protein